MSATAAAQRLDTVADLVLEVAPYGRLLEVFHDVVAFAQRTGCDAGHLAAASEAGIMAMRTERGVPIAAWLPRGLALHLLAHECVHIAVETLDHAGVPLTVEGDEALAYLVDYLFRTLSPAVRRRKKPRPA